MRLRAYGGALLIEAPAKLNLFLEVLGRREDGFHDLETLMLSVGLYDSLRLAAADGGEIRLRLEGCHVPLSAPLQVDDTNLVVRAARLLQTHTGSQQGVRIELTKRIPVEAGMGGGSSDAAATLVGLNRLWQLGLSSGELHALAAQLGSDVNFFLDSAPAALCHGRGEQIAMVPMAGPLPFVILKPKSGCPTGAIFRTLQLGGAMHGPDRLLSALAVGNWKGFRSECYNALQAPAEELNSDVGRALSLLNGNDVVTAGMTGSGSACFGLCRSVRQARMLANRLRQQFDGQVFSVTTSI
ncbi:MAG: 4-(cytidine 5'-diphospho)-2-C-methyl-D-erythritol kinase [Planctomycetaceae bacterium]|nr:4-(cytidine 5'-diphospho)-2-C-methyl-D-erythritol kinase [Planctomycetaceae bacterium]